MTDDPFDSFRIPHIPQYYALPKNITALRSSLKFEGRLTLWGIPAASAGSRGALRQAVVLEWAFHPGQPHGFDAEERQQTQHADRPVLVRIACWSPPRGLGSTTVLVESSYGI